MLAAFAAGDAALLGFIAPVGLATTFAAGFDAGFDAGFNAGFATPLVADPFLADPFFVGDGFAQAGFTAPTFVEPEAFASDLPPAAALAATFAGSFFVAK